MWVWFYVGRHKNINFIDISSNVYLQIDADGLIWVMTNGLPLYNYASLSPHIYNYRIWTRRASDAIRNTVCDVAPNSRY